MPKPSKYKNVRTEVDGITFDSKAEAHRYSVLALLEKGDEISGLELQPEFPIMVGHIERPAEMVKCRTYRADFRYTDTKTGDVIVEDVKGFDTPLSRYKRQLVKANYGITVLCVDKHGVPKAAKARAA